MQGHVGPQAAFPATAHRHSWILALVAAAGVLVLGLVLTSDLPLMIRQIASGLALVAAVLALAASCRRRHRQSTGRRRRAWLLFTLAALAGAVANFWVAAEGLNDQAAGVPAGDILLIVALLLLVAGLVIYPSTPRRGTDLTRMVLDGVVLGGSVLLIAADTLFPQILEQSGSTVTERVAPLVIPVIDLILATVGWLLFIRSSRADRPTLAMAATAFALFAVADGVSAVQRAQGPFSFGTVLDLCWIAGYALLAVGVSWSVRPLPEGGEPSLEHSAVAGTMVMFGMLVIAAFLHLTGEVTSPTADVLLVLILLAVSARQTLLTLDNEVLRRGLEQRVIERSEELREVTQRTDLLVDSVADGVYGVNDQGLVTFVNPAAMKALGFRRRDILGHEAHALFHDHNADHSESDPRDGSDADSCYLTAVITNSIAISGVEDVYRDAEGRLIPVEVTASPLAPDARVRGAVVVFRDVTQRREVDRLKNEFVSMVSHELRTPLTAIRGSLGLLAGGALGELAPPATRMVEIAMDSSRRLTRLIDQILDLERIESGTLPLEIGNYAVSDLVHAAIDQIRIIAEATGVTITATDLPGVVITDPDRVVQTLLNLLGNAVKFSPPNGEVIVCSIVHPDIVEFRIQDHGRGIPEEKLETIFTRFEQVDSSDARDKGGTGLGLAISRSLVERLGGRIWAENLHSGGARFSFVLPRAIEHRTPIESEPLIEEASLRTEIDSRSDIGVEAHHAR